MRSGCRARWKRCRPSTTPPSPGSRRSSTYLDKLELDSLPPDAEHLLLLCYSLVNVSFPVEVWRQARVPDSGAAAMDAVIEPAV